MLKIHPLMVGEERQTLSALISKGRKQAYKIRHASGVFETLSKECCGQNFLR